MHDVAIWGTSTFTKSGASRPEADQQACCRNTDQDVQDLQKASWTEAGVFEITVTGAAAAGLGQDGAHMWWQVLATPGG
jgi:hypothetical protein